MKRTRIVLFVASITAAFFATSVAAWTGPTGSPPNNNVAAPINTSASGQVKTGDFATLGKIGIGTASPSASFKLHIESGTTWTAYLHNSYGGISIGPGNASWTHIYADNPALPFIFNTDIYTTTNAFSSYSGDMLLKTAGTTRVTVGADGIVVVPGAMRIGGPNSGAKLNVDTLGAGIWAQLINYNAGSPLGAYGVYSYGTSYALYGSGPVYGASFLYLSDARWKHNVKNLDKGILTLMKLRPVSFTWNDNAPDGHGGKDDIGFIAQEMEKVLPDAVHTDPATTYKEIDYPRLVPVLVQAIQDQQAEIDRLNARIEALEAKTR